MTNLIRFQPVWLLLLLVTACTYDTDVPETLDVVISVQSEPLSGGTATGGGSYQPGQTVTVHASAGPQHFFRHWTENGTIVSSDSVYSFAASVSRNLTAVFYDFRDSVTGNYTGTRNYYLFIIGNPPTNIDSTWSYTFTVSKHPTSMDSIIADGTVFPMDTSFSYFEMNTPSNVRSLDFRNDSCIIYFRSGGLGGFSTTTIRGLKQ